MLLHRVVKGLYLSNFLSQILLFIYFSPSVENSHGKPLQSCSVEVLILRSMIRSYFCFLVLALRPCHGRLPRMKYISTYPNDSRSSLRLCSTMGGCVMLPGSWFSRNLFALHFFGVQHHEVSEVDGRGDPPIPMWVFMLAYRAVPVKFLFSR